MKYGWWQIECIKYSFLFNGVCVNSTFQCNFFLLFCGMVWCVCVCVGYRHNKRRWLTAFGWIHVPCFFFPLRWYGSVFFCVWQFKENDDVHHFHSIDCVQIFPFSVEKDTCSFHTRHSYSIINFWMIKYAVCCLYVDSRRFTAYFIQVLSTRYFTCIRFTFLCSERWKWKFDSTQFHLFLFK